ncbi:hypothetical protein COY16_03010 [Candidatus Roizmanbacteria bacterium CG_4_10_14_0_2_um_filter_39_13]|uniref:Uncharacterized protein n=1 Tax=Candidatus Roizmanbacteria bacterium CG_4_10_14_0_2_um_filter_39_13 TaxID=1974825 RepID=A0A2M7TYU1_9BACT|nr:MAG: hypothetical protein COY16_03010 [Candidatus Roizmanbacteria bacterium CG_4_10_14_0_2_um_filter_39_13]
MTDSGEGSPGMIAGESTQEIHLQHAEQALKETRFIQKARDLYAKFELTDVVPDMEEVIQDARVFSEIHGVSEEFLSDEINLGLLLGTSQKLRETNDLSYRKRIEGFRKRLIAPDVGGNILDLGEGDGDPMPEHGGLDETAAREYVISKTDPVATQEFVEKHSAAIARCKEVWKSKGHNLNIQVHIVDDEASEFRRKLRAGAFVRFPEKEELAQRDNDVVVEMVMHKGFSAEKEGLICHELYHIEDYWGFVRRGYEGAVLESIDELHTEHAVGNYVEGGVQPAGENAYFTLKDFWDKVSYVGDIDFDSIADRTQTLETIAKQFGLDGLVNLSLKSAHSSGNLSLFETFFSESERAILEMLISREKITLRRGLNDGSIADSMQLVPESLQKLSQACAPDPESMRPRYQSVAELIPTKNGKVYGSRPNRDHSRLLLNEEVKNQVISYARAVSIAELRSLGELPDGSELPEIAIEALAQIPHRRRSVDFKPEAHLSKQFERRRKYAESDEDCYEDIVHSMYIDLVHEMPGTDLAFGLQNQAVRDQMLHPFFAEVDKLAIFCTQYKNPNFAQWIVDGIYGYNMSFELRDATVEHLMNNFPELVSRLQEKKDSFNAKKVSNMSM